MSILPNSSKTGRRQFHAHEVNASIHKAIRDVRRCAKRQPLDADSEIIMVCAVAADIWRRHDRLFRGPSEIKDDAVRTRLAGTLWAAADPILRQICDLRPATREGYRARAARVHDVGRWRDAGAGGNGQSDGQASLGNSAGPALSFGDYQREHTSESSFVLVVEQARKTEPINGQQLI